MRILAVIVLFSASAWAQSAPANPLVASSKAMFEIVKSDILKTAEQVPESLYSYKPTDGVRTMGQLLAHVADGQYEFCGAAQDGKPQMKGIEKTAKTKAEIQQALDTAFGFCESVYASLTDADAAALMPFFGRKMSKLGIMDFNAAHTFEHYGNLVTYMRMNQMVPPSSAPRK